MIVFKEDDPLHVTYNCILLRWGIMEEDFVKDIEIAYRINLPYDENLERYFQQYSMEGLEVVDETQRYSPVTRLREASEERDTGGGERWDHGICRRIQPVSAIGSFTRQTRRN